MSGMDSPRDLDLYRPLSRFSSSILTSSFRLCLWCSRYNASWCCALRRRPSITASINCRRTDRRSVCAGGFRIEEEACIVMVISRDLSQWPATFATRLAPLSRCRALDVLQREVGAMDLGQSRLTEEPPTG